MQQLGPVEARQGHQTARTEVVGQSVVNSLAVFADRDAVDEPRLSIKNSSASLWLRLRKKSVSSQAA